MLLLSCVAAKASLEDAAELERCAQVLASDRTELLECRVPLLAALHQDRIPGYRYNATEDCEFWAHFGTRDRRVENSKSLGFNKIAAYRLSEPFDPPLRWGGTALYIGAHVGGDDGLELHRRHNLQMHLFEPSRSFFRSLLDSVGNVSGLHLHNYGLGSRTRTAQLQIKGTGSTTLPVGAVDRGGVMEEVLIRSAAEVARDIVPNGNMHLDLLHVNCEGCEYDVVEGLQDAGVLASVEQVQIATHLLEWPSSTFEDSIVQTMQLSIRRYCDMHRILALTHERSFGLPWVWERWTLRQR